MRNDIPRRIVLVGCILPMTVTFLSAFFVVGLMLSVGRLGAIEIMDASFVVGTGLSALAFMMASCLDPSKQPAIRDRLVSGGALLAIGSILVLVSMVIRYAVRYGDASWWAHLALGAETSRRAALLFFILVPYEAGSIVALIGLIAFVDSIGRWFSRQTDSGITSPRA